MKNIGKFVVLGAALAVFATFAHADQAFNSSLSGPGVYWGTGNQNSGWDVLTTTNTDGSTLQLGLEGITRFVGPITPSVNDYSYSPSVSPLATWNFAFSVNTGTDPLSAYTYTLTITDDTTHATFAFDPTLLGDSGQVKGSTFICKGCAYDSTNTGFQNAENLGFGFLSGPLGFDPSAAHEYTIALSALPVAGNNVDPSVSINMIPLAPTPAPTPEPSSLMLLGTGLFSGVGMLMRRRRVAA